MTLDVLVVFNLVVGVFVKILEHGVKLWWECVLQVTDVLSEPHVDALVNSAQFFQSLGCVTVDFGQLLCVLCLVLA